MAQVKDASCGSGCSTQPTMNASSGGLKVKKEPIPAFGVPVQRNIVYPKGSYVATPEGFMVNTRAAAYPCNGAWRKFNQADMMIALQRMGDCGTTPFFPMVKPAIEGELCDEGGFLQVWDKGRIVTTQDNLIWKSLVDGNTDAPSEDSDKWSCQGFTWEQLVGKLIDLLCADAAGGNKA